MGNGGGERWQWHCESAATHRQWFQISSGFLICPTEVPAGGPESFLVQKSERLKRMKVTAIGVCSWFQGAKQATKLEERGSSKAFQLLTSFSRKTGDSKNSLSAEKNDFYIDVSNFGCPQASSIIMTRKGKRIKSWQSKEHHPWFPNGCGHGSKKGQPRKQHCDDAEHHQKTWACLPPSHSPGAELRTHSECFF